MIIKFPNIPICIKFRDTECIWRRKNCFLNEQFPYVDIKYSILDIHLYRMYTLFLRVIYFNHIRSGNLKDVGTT